MDSCAAFKPMGNTYAIAAAASPPTPVAVLGPVAGDVSYMIHNSGTVPAFIAWGPSAAVATANAVAPVAGTPQPVIPVAAGGTKVFTLTGQSGGVFFTAVASSASTVYITTGWGI